MDRVGQPKASPTWKDTAAGVYASVAQRPLALTAAIWPNWRTNADIKRSLTAYDQ